MPKLIRCPNGHFYDFDRTPRCPYCAADEIYPPMPPDCPGEEEFMRRLAEREAAERERGVTVEVPPVDERTDKTVPLDDSGTDRTSAGGWQRTLLTVTAALAAACTLFSFLDMVLIW